MVALKVLGLLSKVHHQLIRNLLENVTVEHALAFRHLSGMHTAVTLIVDDFLPSGRRLVLLLVILALLFRCLIWLSSFSFFSHRCSCLSFNFCLSLFLCVQVCRLETCPDVASYLVSALLFKLEDGRLGSALHT